ncbi:hypothetical protein ABLE91_20935 [Aquabacter sp. CN5-332]|uniref:hypothetical protein n=1 Tax=Aquabacter sp. CN5-332 TaxID=3156608 RepID=UPI0032B44869
MKRHFRWILAGAGLVALLASSATLAQTQQVSAASCAGAAMLGGTQLMCSHTDPTAPAEFCTFSWTLQTTAGAPKIVEGSFMVPPGANNLVVYQSGGFSAALANPIILCQGRAERDAK